MGAKKRVTKVSAHEINLTTRTAPGTLSKLTPYKVRADVLVELMARLYVHPQ